MTPIQRDYEAIRRQLADDEAFQEVFLCTDENVENLLKRCRVFADAPTEINSASGGKVDHSDVQLWLLDNF